MFKKLQKNQKGFTLVEVIVVAVIVAVLAAVAIPLYMGYIKDSRINVAQNVAGTIASAAGATVQQDPTKLPAAADYTTLIDAATPTALTFKGLNGTDNTINIPQGYTATLTASTVVVYYTSDKTVTSKTFTFTTAAQ
jgi:prepilin-type N-terminal cleavage/methylation domain-containing protein